MFSNMQVAAQPASRVQPLRSTGADVVCAAVLCSQQAAFSRSLGLARMMQPCTARQCLPHAGAAAAALTAPCCRPCLCGSRWTRQRQMLPRTTPSSSRPRHGWQQLGSSSHRSCSCRLATPLPAAAAAPWALLTLLSRDQVLTATAAAAALQPLAPAKAPSAAAGCAG